MTRQQGKLCAFPPLIGKAPHTLILGTMPGAKSLEHGQYYAHPQNQFWRLMGDIYGALPSLPYEQRIAILTQQNVAVWDVLRSCTREGSMDADIRDAEPNDFAAFFKKYPTIRRVIFDSAKAEEIFLKRCTANLPGTLHYHRVPSPSPAHARLRYEQKLALWKDVLEKTTD